MKNILTIIIVLYFIILGSCSGDSGKKKPNEKRARNEIRSKETVISNPMSIEGVGPVKGLILDLEIDQAMVKQGAHIFKLKCKACHKPYRKFIGPDLSGITERRNPSWIMNMILNPSEMVKEDPLAKKMFEDFNGSPMINQNLNQKEARAILEYFRTLD